MNKIMLAAGFGAFSMVSPFAVALADGPAPEPVVVAPSASSAGGFYVGARLGHGWLDATARSGVEDQSYDPKGGFAGILAGYDQVLQGPWSVGGVIDFMAGNERGTLTLSGPVVFKLDQQWEASLRGRVAYALEGFSPYATAGLSYGSFKTQYRQVILPFVSEESQEFGWTIGAGVDVPVDERLGLVFEYRYTDYGNDVDALGGIDGPYEVNSSKVYLGVNYKL
ncbi:MAG: outer membrane protein [Alphaproteobacteria bacterium]